MIGEKIMKTKDKRNPLVKFHFLFYVSVIMLFFIVNFSNTAYAGERLAVSVSIVRKIPSVITIKENCNIRSGPGTKYSIVFKTERGVAFKVIKEKGSWISVQHADGDKGWIYKPLVW